MHRTTHFPGLDLRAARGALLLRQGRGFRAERFCATAPKDHSQNEHELLQRPRRGRAMAQSRFASRAQSLLRGALASLWE